MEFDISNVLTRDCWNVINNKYYVDDHQETVREIDIVAYKVGIVQGICVYTVLIISCKKSEQNAWALLSKKADHNDPNVEWVPVHAWSNDRKLSFMFGEQKWKKTYLSVLKQNQSNIVSDKPKRHIFGFQEMRKDGGSPQNDKNIFNSITSVMKAQAYEMNALPLRKKDPCVFQFNLISVAQTDLIRLDFDEDQAKGELIDDEIYLANYIVDKQQTFAKVHFIKSDKFEFFIKQYSNLHESNKKAFDVLYNKFCSEITKDSKKLNLFTDDVAEDVWWLAFKSINKFSETRKLFSKGWMNWNAKDEILEFQIELDNESITKLNSDNAIREALSESLKKHYTFTGNSKFAEYEIPF